MDCSPDEHRVDILFGDVHGDEIKHPRDFRGEACIALVGLVHTCRDICNPPYTDDNERQAGLGQTLCSTWTNVSPRP